MQEVGRAVGAGHALCGALALLEQDGHPAGAAAADQDVGRPVPVDLDLSGGFAGDGQVVCAEPEVEGHVRRIGLGPGELDGGHGVTVVGNDGMIAEQAARDLGGIGLAGLDLDFRSLERLAVLGGGQGVRTGFHIDGIGPELGFHAVGGFEDEGGSVIGLGFDVCGGYGLPDGDLGPGVGSDGDVAGGAADRDLVVGVPGLELCSGKRCAGAHDGLIDRELHRSVGLVGCGFHLGGGAVLVGEGERHGRLVDHMARGGLGLDEGVGRRAAAEVEFLGGGAAVLPGLHMVDDVSGRGAHGAVGGHDFLLRHDVVLCALKRLAVMRARLRDGRLALRLLV